MPLKQINLLILGCVGPNQDRIESLAKQVDKLVYAYTEFNVHQLLLDGLIQIAIPRRNMVELVDYLIDRYQINIIYSLLNAHDASTEATLELLDAQIKIPIVRHYKEHPCFPTVEEKRILTETAAQIYINQESLSFFRNIYDVNESTSHLMDADMISVKYMTEEFQPKLYEQDNKPHLLVAGSISAGNDRLDMRELCLEMNKRNVCVHLYGNMVGENYLGQQVHNDPQTLREYQKLSDRETNIRLHKFIPPSLFTHEWSKYDAGFMHASPRNPHEQNNFEEMNMPYRYSAYLSAGLPLMISNSGQNAMKRLISEHEIGFAFKNYDELAEFLHDRKKLKESQDSAKEKRFRFSYEASIPYLIDVLRKYSL